MAIRKVVSRSNNCNCTSRPLIGVGGSNVKLYSVTPQTVTGASGVSVVIIHEGFIATPTVHFVMSWYWNTNCRFCNF